jgi:hypothetical protein
MWRIVQWILNAAISPSDAERAFNGVDTVSLADCADIAARIVCVLEQPPALTKEEGHG